SSKTIYKTFSTSGTKRFQVRVTDSKNQTKTAECSVFIEEEEADPISVACYVSPSRADVNEEVRIYAEVSGGTPSYNYS
ncbi:MAG: hypothetical protein PHP14_01190, partial [Candidatus Pacebacteria bacterium]|nr:hypothetical protein [Candidatus Paceibacterota bacterium]